MADGGSTPERLVHVDGLGPLDPDQFPVGYVDQLVMASNVRALSQHLPVIFESGPSGKRADIDTTDGWPEGLSRILTQSDDDPQVFALDRFDYRPAVNRGSADKDWVRELTLRLPPPESLRRPTSFEVTDIGARFAANSGNPHERVSSQSRELLPSAEDLLVPRGYSYYEGPDPDTSDADGRPDTAEGDGGIVVWEYPLEDERTRRLVDGLVAWTNAPISPFILDLEVTVEDQTLSGTSGMDLTTELYSGLSELAASDSESLSLKRVLDNRSATVLYEVTDPSGDVLHSSL